jgi:S-adenosylmethionine:tRNA ribosyltransferase-isomerase
MPARDDSRLLVLYKDTGKIEHKLFCDLILYLKEGDVLVLNDTKVFPARLRGVRKDKGQKIEVLVHTERGPNLWEALVKPGKLAKVGKRIVFSDGFEGEIVRCVGERGRLIKFDIDRELCEVLEEFGEVPLPPYIKRQGPSDPEDKERYQTVYASSVGAIAAPTAGLHFSEKLINQLDQMGVKITKVTLHIGIATFKPIRTEEIERYKLASEFYRISQEAAETINQKKGRLIAVGTTAVRALESAADDSGKIKPQEGWTELYIYPGYKFKVVEALITNFHLPKSTPLILTSAFAGKDLILSVYKEAIGLNYRFLSFGDAILIL